MFKNVEYADFDRQPELEAKARELTPILANEIRTWREDVSVRWSPHKDSSSGVLDLTLSLALPNGVAEMRTGTLLAEDFERERRLASRCGQVWSDLLGGLIGQLDNRVQEFFLEPAEA
ncbi:MAG: hypothetical protein K8U57_21965 [Planctomycetes bacterium]|nr:hypothetical protein [Planctomycetota bacterium]